MSQLCFASFASAMQRALRESPSWWNEHIGVPQNTNKVFPTQAIAGQHYTVRRLLDWITELSDVRDRNGKPVYIDDSIASHLMDHSAELNAAIVTCIQQGDLDTQAIDEFRQIITELIKYKVNDLMREISDLIKNDPEVSEAQKRDLLTLCKKETLAEFLASTFLYACCLKNKLRHIDLNNDEGWLIHVSDNICPLCHKKTLTKVDGLNTIKNYDAVELTLPPSSKHRIQMLVCVTCSRKPDLKFGSDGSEPKAWATLRQAYGTYQLKQRIEEVFENNTLPSQISDVVNSLVESPMDDQLKKHKKDDWDPKVVERKIKKSNWVLAEQIKSLADAYYYVVRDAFAAIDDGSTRRFRRIRNQVASCYLDLADITNDQNAIFNGICHWIARQAGVAITSQAALVITAFFVQNCEVFDEISK